MSTRRHRTGSAVTGSGVSELSDADEVEIESLSTGTVATDLMTHSVTLSDNGTAEEGAYTQLTLPSSLAAANPDSALSLSVCARLGGVIGDGVPLPLASTFSLYVDATYTDTGSTAGDLDTVVTNGLVSPFDPGYIGWQCRDVQVPLLPPVWVGDMDVDGRTRDVSVSMFINVLYNWHTTLDTIPDCSFVVAAATLVPVNYIADPTLSYVSAVTDYPLSWTVTGWTPSSTSDGDMTLSAYVGQGSLRQTIVLDSQADTGFTGCALLLTGCLLPPVVDETLNEDLSYDAVLYADLVLSSGDYSYGYMTSVMDTDGCVSMFLPGQVDGLGVTHVQLHLLANNPVTPTILYSIGLTPVTDNCPALETPGMAHGDPHLQTVSGYTYDHFTPGDHRLSEVILDDEYLVRTDYRTVTVGDQSTSSEELPSIATAVALGYGTTNGPLLSRLGFANISFDTVVQVIGGSSVEVKVNDVSIALPTGTLDSTYALDTAGDGSLTASFYSDDQGAVNYSYTVSVYGLMSLTIDVTRSLTDVYFIDSRVSLSTDITSIECEGLLGTCSGDEDEDETYITAYVEANESLLSSSTLLPEDTGIKD
ncbi:hypothetical protein KIPB_005468 [Kipferlia bialata]|uniref:Uncharacterized protein n=1 Tax=Kipferlia bialata TaxID=797122 RepID=A0A9K3GIJ5_9EUKA|nr:hypothetical protein KIPB_005468 [Kipferlia bialata]|eukprot:g5468.t1